MINTKHLISTFILILFIFNLDIIITSVLDSSYLFFNNIFVSTFPFIILSKILIYFDYHLFLSNTIGKALSKIFNIDKNSSIVVILSMLTSEPSNSIYLKNLLDNNIINENEANKVLAFTYFPSIAFIIGTIGIKLHDNVNIGIVLLLSNYLCNILIGLYLRKYKYDNENIIINQNKESFFTMIKNSIIESFNTSMIILGNIIIFTIIINLLNKYIYLGESIRAILSGILELTNGINNTSLLNIDNIFKITLSCFILNFSGLSIIMQSKSILSNYKINIKKILTIKLVFSLITSGIIFMSLSILNIY